MTFTVLQKNTFTVLSKNTFILKVTFIMIQITIYCAPGFTLTFLKKWRIQCSINYFHWALEIPMRRELVIGQNYSENAWCWTHFLLLVTWPTHQQGHANISTLHQENPGHLCPYGKHIKTLCLSNGYWKQTLIQSLLRPWHETLWAGSFSGFKRDLWSIIWHHWIPQLQLQENKVLFRKESPLAKSMFSTRRERLPPLPPSFESLMKSEDTVPPLLELDENALTEELQSFPSSGSSIESIFQKHPPVFFCQRKRRSSEKSMDEEVSNCCQDKLRVNAVLCWPRWTS